MLHELIIYAILPFHAEGMACSDSALGRLYHFISFHQLSNNHVIAVALLDNGTFLKSVALTAPSGDT
ncbi:hypothetical protein Ahy_A01g004125 isoform A [Arachis hypogaea]|uniref:Uncharacterized protein n=1 Tax=Arachis hypogaea TaxID=3818 RepID=A0A445EUZ6_ARAHY|nr:hypothetical protein Ahy_A01g004125 isoform A [Arachis hypogaea]